MSMNTLENSTNMLILNIVDKVARTTFLKEIKIFSLGVSVLVDKDQVFKTFFLFICTAYVFLLLLKPKVRQNI